MRRWTTLSVDVLLIAAATIVALAIRDNFDVSMDAILRLIPYLLLTLAVAVPLLLAIRQDRLIWRLSGLTDYMRITAGVAAIIVLTTSIGFTLNRLDGISRSLPVLQGIVMTFLLVGSRVLIREFHAWRRRGRAGNRQAASLTDVRECVLIVGVNRIAELYLESVAEFAADRIMIAGLLGRAERHNGRMIQQQRILGVPQDVARVLQDLELHGMFVTRIVVAMEFDRLPIEAQSALLAVARGSEIELDFFAQRTRIAPSRSNGSDDTHARTGGAQTAPVTYTFDVAKLQTVPSRRYWAIKRGIDVVGASVMLVLTIPFMIAISAVLAVRVGFPLIFWQMRPGRFGRPFRVYKFRTMGDGFDASGARIDDKDREFSFGRLLRRTRLDELPQLYNILVGEMSFVGPRPLLPVDQEGAYAARLLVRPGLTGWAQVQGGRGVSALDKAALDVWYVDNASLALDCRVVLLTVPMVLFGEQINTLVISNCWQDLKTAGVYDGPVPPA